MSIFSRTGTPNLNNNQPNSNQNNTNAPQKNLGIFSLGQNSISYKAPPVNATGIFGATAQNQTSNLSTGLFQNNPGNANIFQSNTNIANQNNFTNPTMSTPLKNNNLSSGSTNALPNLFGNNTQNNTTSIFGNNTATSNNGVTFNTNANATGTNTSIFPNATTNTFKNNNSNSTNQPTNNLFNPNNEQKSMFNMGNQNQGNTISGNTALNQIFNQNPSNANQTLFSQTQSTNKLNTLTSNVTTNPTQITSNFSLFNNDNTQQNQPSNQNAQQSNANQLSIFNTGSITNQTLSANTQNIFGNQQPQQNSIGMSFNSSKQNNQQAGQASLFATSSSLILNPTDNQNQEIKILPIQTLPKNDMFAILGQPKPENKSFTGGLFSSNNAKVDIFENQTKADSTLAASLFTSLNQATTSNKNLFGEPQNTTNLTSENRPQFITAPSNILGINLDSLSENVKKACRSENKSIKDFIQEVEKDFQKEDYRDYYRKIPNNISTSFAHGYKGMEEYHERQKYQGHKQTTNSKDKLSEFDYYQNFSIYNRSSGLSHQRDNYSYLQTKILRSPVKENNYNFNRNVIELSLKVRNNTGSKASSFYQSSYKDERLNNENISENLIDNDILDTSLIDVYAKSEIPNGANNNDKMIEILIELKSEGFPNFKIPLNINKNNVVSLLKESIIDKLKEREEQFFKFLTLDSVILMKQNTLMTDSKLISEYNVVNGDKITLILSRANDDDNDNSDSMGYKHLRKGKFHLRNIKKNEVAPLEFLPTLTMAGYKTYPDFKILCRMTLEELRNVDNFCIWNEYGKIEWKDSVDLTELDLDKIIEIRQCLILVYQGKDAILAPKGERLNKPSIFTLNNIKSENELRTENDRQKFVALLKGLVMDQGGKYIDYDYDNYKLVFECNEFKKEKI